jgi:hypothetical protein
MKLFVFFFALAQCLNPPEFDRGEFQMSATAKYIKNTTFITLTNTTLLNCNMDLMRYGRDFPDPFHVFNIKIKVSACTFEFSCYIGLGETFLAFKNNFKDGTHEMWNSTDRILQNKATLQLQDKILSNHDFNGTLVLNFGKEFDVVLPELVYDDITWMMFECDLGDHQFKPCFYFPIGQH